MPPEPVLVGIDEDEAGRLWVYTRIPRADWRRAWQSVPETATDLPLTAIDMEYLYHTRIEVLDVSAARVMTRHTLDRMVTAVLPGRRATFVLEDALSQHPGTAVHAVRHMTPSSPCAAESRAGRRAAADPSKTLALVCTEYHIVPGTLPK